MDNPTVAAGHEAELRNCVQSFEHFCENYIKVNHPLRGNVPYTLHDYQKRYARFLEENRFVVCKKFRQGGFTTETLAYLLWNALFKLDKRIMVLSRTDREAMDLCAKFRQMLYCLPEWMPLETVKQNNHQIHFKDTGARLYFYTPEASCGTRIDILYLDEAAFIPNMDCHWKAMWPTLSTGGKCFAVSTVKGVGDWFYDIYTRAEKGENMFKIFECHYTEHPDYQKPEWVKQMRSQLGERGWQQEILCNFVPESFESVWRPGIDFACDITPQQEKDFLDKAERKTKAERKDAMFDEIMRQAKNKTKNVFKDVFGKTKTMHTDKDIVITHDDDHEPRLCFTETENKICGVEIDMSVPNVRKAKKIGGSGCEQDAVILTETIGEHDRRRRTEKCRTAECWPHPVFNKDIMASKEEYADMLDALGIPEVKQSMERKEKDVKKKIENVDKFLEGQPDLLVLSGVMDTESVEEIENSRPCREVLVRVTDSGEFPENLTLAFIGGRLHVSGVQTMIKEKDVMDAYSGLCGLTSHEQAMESVARLIKEKLVPLYGKG